MLVSDSARMLTYPRLRGNSPPEKQHPFASMGAKGGRVFVLGQRRVSNNPLLVFPFCREQSYKSLPHRLPCPAHPALSFPRFAVHLSASKTSPSKENKTIFHFRNQASWYIRHPP